MEQGFYDIALKAYGIGFSAIGRVGSCALVAIVSNNKLYAANIGDCKGVICYEDDKNKNEIKSRKINHKLNANSKKEQKRLKASFPNEPDIVICRRG